MLPAFDLAQLALPTALIFAAALLAGWRVTGSPALAWNLALLKAGIYLFYFGVIFDGRYTFLDDLTYLDRGAALHAAGIGLSNALDNLPLLVAVGEGDHFLYYLYNAVAIGWFGDGYYAPVAFNVIAAVGVAWMATQLVVKERLVTPRAAPVFFGFVMLHPDITAWSTVMNGKDTLVLLLHVVLLTAMSMLLRGRRLQALVLATATVGILLFLRFYVPLMFAAALVLAAVLRLRGAARWRVLMLALLGLTSLVWNLGVGGIEFALESLRADLVNPAIGLVRFLLTPIPFNTEPAYNFLDFPALLHWLLLPAALLGMWRVHRMGTPFTRFLMIYALIFAALYAVYGELQGPRHRLQLDFVWATFQFIGMGLGGLTQLRRCLPAGAPLRGSA